MLKIDEISTRKGAQDVCQKEMQKRTTYHISNCRSHIAPPISRNKKIKVEFPEQRRDGNPNRCQITHSTHSNPMSLNTPQYP